MGDEIARSWYDRVSDGRLPFEWVVRSEKDIVNLYWRERYGGEEFEAAWLKATENAVSAFDAELLFWLYCIFNRRNMTVEAGEAAEELLRLESKYGVNFLSRFVEVKR